MGDELQDPAGILASVFDFLKVLGASLTGLTAILTAAGFLAERSRLAMLGLPSATFDLELYVETGAFFLALLPVVLGVGSFLILFSWIEAPLSALLSLFTLSELFVLLLALSILGVVLYRWLRSASHDSQEAHAKPGRGRRLLTALRDRTRRRLGAIRKGLRRHTFKIVLAVALLVQIWSVGQELSVLEIENVLFEAPEAETQQAPGVTEGWFDDSTEMGEIVREGRDEFGLSMRLFGGIVLSTVLSASVLYFVVKNRLSRDRPRWRHVALMGWTLVTVLLLVSQMTLLPYSYGVLLSQNLYPEVCPILSVDPVERGNSVPASRLSLVHQTGDGFYLYSKAAQRMWYLPRNEVETLVYYDRTDVLDAAEPEPCPVEAQR